MSEDEATMANSNTFCVVDSSVLSELNHDANIQLSLDKNCDANTKNGTKINSDLKDSDIVVRLTESITTSQSSTSDGIRTNESSIISDEPISTESKNQNEKIDAEQNRARLRLPKSCIVASVFVCMLGVIVVVFRIVRLNSLPANAIPKDKNDLSVAGKSHNFNPVGELFLQKHLSLLVYNANQYVQCLRQESSRDQLDNCNGLLRKFTETKFYNKTDHNVATQQWIASIENDLTKLTIGVKELLVDARVDGRYAEKTRLSWIPDTARIGTDWIIDGSNSIRDGISKSSTVVKNRIINGGNAAVGWLSWMSKKSMSLATGSRDSLKGTANTCLTWMSKKSKNVIYWIKSEKKTDEKGTQENSQQVENQHSEEKRVREQFLKMQSFGKSKDSANIKADSSGNDIRRNQQKIEQSNEQYPENKSNGKSWFARVFEKSKNTVNKMMNIKKGNSATVPENLEQESGHADTSWLGWLFDKNKSITRTNTISHEKEMDNDEIQQNTAEAAENPALLSRIRTYYRTQVSKAYLSLNWISDNAKRYSKKAFYRT